MRVFPNDMIRWTMEAVGFQTVVMPITDVYLAIQQGTVDGQENPVDTIKSLRFYRGCALYHPDASCLQPAAFDCV